MRQHANTKGATDGYGGVAIDPHKDAGGKRKGRSMKRKGYRRIKPQPTVAMARAALAIDPNAQWNPKLKCLVYNRKVG
jgi:hypothetical protein